MGFFKDELLKVKGFVFDVDGVLSKDTSPLNEDGDPVRTANVKDGFAIRNAVKAGYPVAIITGGFIERVRLRYEKLGVEHYYDKVRDKVEALNDFLAKTNLTAEEIMFMGDDLVDYRVMTEVGLAVCPKDAVQEIKEISKYISDKNGGDGCVRDVIEQTMKAQQKWFTPEMLNARAF
ncbi:HAD hydrolase family protein [Maribellus sp. YY47]|uniref:KdsC family phosphatase n=1 Tax=Maribellus sp. YY47 TaxID=2929486 RepID=UPI002000B4C3|nr:HAD hydrolase family protein [Maribellus sp. YY47]MCK3685675.1 HAD hydrolase family protein [Maribellus sp. YY47]